MKKLIVNYLGEWVYYTQEKRYVLSFDGWLDESKFSDNARFFRAKNQTEVRQLAKAYVRYYYKHKISPKSVLSFFTNNEKKAWPIWQSLLEEEFFYLYSLAIKTNINMSLPDWINNINISLPDIYSHCFLKEIVHWSFQDNIILEESGCSSIIALTKNFKTTIYSSSNKKGSFLLTNENKPSTNNKVYIYWLENWDLDWFKKIKKENSIIITYNENIVKEFEKNMFNFYHMIEIKSYYAYSLYVFFMKASNYIDKNNKIGQLITSKKQQVFYGENLLKSWFKNHNNIQTQKYIQGKAVYISKSRKGQSDSSIPQDLLLPTQKALNKLELNKGNVDSYVSNAVGKEVYSNLAPEQIDAVALMIESLDNSNGFILADVTGKGKGRTLAASIIACLNKGYNVVFMTEKINLFSDLYRDFKNINLIPDMYLLHKDAKIFDESGHLIQKAKIDKEFYKEKHSFIMTTYSQFNRTKKFDSKLEWLKNHVKGDFGQGILVLDESHSAAGQSNISKNIKQLINLAYGVSYSSATFVKTEKNLDIYEKAIPVKKDFFEVMKRTLDNNNFNELRQVITLSMAEKGQFIRREHLIDKKPNKKEVFLTKEQEDSIELFSIIWNHIFELFKLRKEYLKVNGLDKKNDVINHWYKLGNTVNRTSMELSLFFKMDEVEKSIRDILPDRKPVVVLETTMEATLKRLLEDPGLSDWFDSDDKEEESDKKSKLKLPFECQDHNSPLWKYKLIQISKQVADQDMLASADEKTKKTLYNHMDSIASAVEKMPLWPASPIDILKGKFKDYSCDELSGRQVALEKTEKGYKVFDRKPRIRSQIVNDFNKGETDILFITRTGSTGISLHAGQAFKDQRPRRLIEAEIPRDPVQRIQFWGRVSRKDEVAESDIESIILNLPLDIRNWENQNNKQNKALSHVGSLSLKEPLQYVSTYGNAIAYEWLKKNKYFFYKLGLSTTEFDINGSNIVNKLLSRSILINKEKQKELVDFLDWGISIAQDYENNSVFDTNQPSEKKKQLFLYGMSSKEDKKAVSEDVYSLNDPFVYLTQRVFNVKSRTITTEQAIEQIKQLKWPQQEIDSYLNSLEGGDKSVIWLKKILPVLRKGLILGIKRPWDEQYTKSVLGDVVFPKNGVDYGMTTVAVKLWVPGSESPLVMSLWQLYIQKSKFLLKDVLKKDWFEAVGKTESLVYYTLEGNPFLSVLWSLKRNMGKSVNIMDTIEGFKHIVLLPRHITKEDILKQPIDLIKAQQSIDFIKQNKDGILYESTYGKEMVIYWFNNQIMLSVSLNFDKTYFGEIVPFTIRKKLDYPQFIENRIAYKIYEIDLIKIMHSFDNAGISWSIDPIFRQWYEQKGLYI